MVHCSALRDFGEKLGNHPPAQATQDDLTTRTDNVTPSNRTLRSRTQEAAHKSYNLRQAKSPEDIRSQKRSREYIRRETPYQAIETNAGTPTEQTIRSKRKSTTNHNPVVKLTRIDARFYSQDQLHDSSNSRLGLYFDFNFFCFCFIV